MSPKRINREEKRTQILNAALNVFSQKGVSKSKMVDIAAAAGIGKGTIYEYFRSKNEIIEASFQMHFESIHTFLNNNIYKNTNPKEKLEKFITIILNFYKLEMQPLAPVVMDFWAEGVRAKHISHDAFNLRQIYDESRLIITEIIREGCESRVFKNVNPVTTASLIIGMLDGLLIQLSMDPDIIDVEKINTTLHQTFLNGLFDSTPKPAGE